MIKGLIHKKSYKEIVEMPLPYSSLYQVRGLPQGSPTSPFLSCLVLREFILRFPNVQYADDGLYYGDLLDEEGNTRNPIITPNTDMVKSNIYFNLDKSGWVKRNGEWLKPLRFLGLQYDGKLDQLRGSTRNGSDLVFDKQDLIDEVYDLETSIEGDSPQKGGVERDSWQKYIRSRLDGFMQSRLYDGS